MKVYIKRICLRPKFKIIYKYITEKVPTIEQKLETMEKRPILDEPSSSLSSEEIERTETPAMIIREMTPPPIIEKPKES